MLRSFDHIMSFSTDHLESPKYKLSRKFFNLKIFYSRTDGYDNADGIVLNCKENGILLIPHKIYATNLV
jgi:hypothetical protein